VTRGGIQNRGRVIVYSGADASILFEIQGPVAHGSYGYRGVTSVGDVNGDGFDDVAFGSFSAGVHVHLGPNGAHYRSHFGPGTRSSVAGIGGVDGDGHHGARRLPGYIEKELRAALACGDLTHGFARVRCPSCTLDLTGPILVQGPCFLSFVRRAQNG
jgi:hypothetical protein